MQPINLTVILGPTASGKTHLAVALADRLQAEIISADSRQVYRGLDIGTGKDLSEYQLPTRVLPHHLLDIAGLDQEFSVFDFQQAFFKVFADCRNRGVTPLLVGGTGLYLESVLLNYPLVLVPPNPVLRSRLAGWTEVDLAERLRSLGKKLQNRTGLENRERLLRAVEIAEYEQTHAPEPRPAIVPLVLGVHWERGELRRRIAERLQTRLQQGLIGEVARLHSEGVSWQRLQSLGLEYRYGAEFLLKKWRTQAELFTALNTAIGQFAKRQDTWFRRMERRGIVIHWVEQGNLEEAWALISRTLVAS